MGRWYVGGVWYNHCAQVLHGIPQCSIFYQPTWQCDADSFQKIIWLFKAYNFTPFQTPFQEIVWLYKTYCMDTISPCKDIVNYIYFTFGIAVLVTCRFYTIKVAKLICLAWHYTPSTNSNTWKDFLAQNNNQPETKQIFFFSNVTQWMNSYKAFYADLWCL